MVSNLLNRTTEQIEEQQQFISLVKDEFNLSNKAICTDFIEDLTDFQNKGCSLIKLGDIVRLYKPKILEIVKRRNTFNNEVMTAFGVLYLTYGAYKKLE